MAEHDRDEPARPPALPYKLGATLPSKMLAILGVGTLAGVVLTDWLFFGHPAGWTTGLYGALLVGALFVRVRRLPAGGAQAVLTVVPLLLCLSCIEEPNRLSVALGILGLVTLALSLREGWSASAVVWAQRWLLYGLASWFSSRRAGSDPPPLGGRRPLCGARWRSISFLACGLVWILVRVASGRSTQWLVNVNALTAAAVLFACAFLNVDGAIASFNVRHCEELCGQGYPAIDVGYLESLGYDAVPALLWLSGQVGDHPRAGSRCRNAILVLERKLQADLADWRGWTLRRARIWRRLQQRSTEVSP